MGQERGGTKVDNSLPSVDGRDFAALLEAGTGSKPGTGTTGTTHSTSTRGLPPQWVKWCEDGPHVPATRLEDRGRSSLLSSLPKSAAAALQWEHYYLGTGCRRLLTSTSTSISTSVSQRLDWDKYSKPRNSSVCPGLLEDASAVWIWASNDPSLQGQEQARHGDPDSGGGQRGEWVKDWELEPTGWLIDRCPTVTTTTREDVAAKTNFLLLRLKVSQSHHHLNSTATATAAFASSFVSCSPPRYSPDECLPLLKTPQDLYPTTRRIVQHLGDEARNGGRPGMK
ncbi:hypothetical protein CORC01_01484 [Colletotrichum orchidophilum]|uniref:Uncharacterized protein n=1 Tax=Colletotrichum orchidophilum TaxID=1209926 RepID=A0A1G4BNS0_9PEZI|nr:uncharacterized protein CORC01_01484 [Colletotrichum orchidophilum]OHF03100.1 hypothetical protein CORC01_01484 [Colletotrichum orchidophilum]